MTIKAYSRYSNIASATTALPAPSAFSVTASAFDTCDLAWTDNSTGEDGFEVYRSTPTNGSYSLLATTAANAVSYSDDTCEAETTYYYKIRAKKGTVFSSYAAEDSDTTPSALSEDITGASFALKFDEYWDNFTGITSDAATNGIFGKQDSTDSFTLGNGDWVMEAVWAWDGAGDGWIFGTGDNPVNTGTRLQIKPSSNVVYWDLYLSGGAVTISFTVPGTNFPAGVPRLIKLVVDRTNAISKFYVDNVQIGGDGDISGIGSSNILTKTLAVMADYQLGAGGNGHGTFYEVAFGKGVTTLGSRGPGSGVCPYNYLSDSTTGLVAHWKMQEASGDITDSKSSIVLADSGTLTYSVAGAGKAAALYDEVAGYKVSPSSTAATHNSTVGAPLAAFSPGVYYPSGAFHRNQASPAGLALGATEDCVIEWFMKWASTSTGNMNPWSTAESGDGYKGFLFTWSVADNKAHLYFGGDSSAGYVDTSALTADFRDDTVHLWTLIIDRSANMQLLVDGVDQGSYSISTYDNQTVTASQLHMPGHEGTNGPGFTHYFWKMTKGTTTPTMTYP